MLSDDQLDEQLGRLAKRSIAESATAVDTDAALDVHRARPQKRAVRHGPRRQMAAAAALLVVAVGALIATAGDDNARLVVSDRTLPPASAPSETEVTTVPRRTDTIAPASGATSTTSVTTAPTTTPTTVRAVTPTTVDTGHETTSLPLPSGTIAVSYLDPPPLYEPQPFAEIEANTGAPWVALGDGYAAVGAPGRFMSEPQPDRAFVVPLDKPTDISEIEVEFVPDAMIAGPGPVVYGGQLGELDDARSTATRFVAIALTGPNAGNVVSEIPGFVHAAEPFDNVYVHGKDGVVDRWADGAFVMSYVDASGAPLEMEDDEWPRFDVIESWPDQDPAADEIFDVATGETRWTLQIVRSPEAPSHLEGRASPGVDGTAIRMTWIGPRVGDDPDYGRPTVPVIAALNPDGSGTWHRLPEGWEVADSNKWGTLLMRSAGGFTQLAVFDPTAP